MSKFSLPFQFPFSSVQLLSRVWLFVTHGLQHARPPCPTLSPRACSNSCPSSWWCHPTISSSVVLPLLPSVFPSIRVFSNESVLHIRWPKYWHFSFSISLSNEHPGLISFRMDWLDLLAVQGTLKSLLQHHNSKASILWCSTSFMVQLSHPYMTTEKAITLIRQNLPGNIMSLLFNMLPRFVIAFLPRRFPISVRLIEIGVDLLTIICSILSSLLWSCLRAGTYLGNPSVLTRHSTYIYQMNKWMHSEMNM